ncbi:MAG: hypothetical protein M1834_002577 [Cirrosporium novae-zelandiae]|nr:MAG: hypothetical protein M1834_002577 [Cirrosporium novae-zelandiae]
MAEEDKQNLWGVVDMGSNGIRFSISDLSPKSARVMPTLFQERIAISLYDVQYSDKGEKQPIPEEVMLSVTTEIARFKSICHEFGIPSPRIKILATEATREAMNSNIFLDQISIHTSAEIPVQMLPKSDEGKLGSFGIASSFHNASGIIMDLGGGSTQISYLLPEDNLKSGDDASINRYISLPYGAAALKLRLAEAEKQGKAGKKKLHDEIKDALKQAYSDLNVPESLTQQAETSGMNLYLSGGGFRAWGYLLMHTHDIAPYPIPHINGFSVPAARFYNTEPIKPCATTPTSIFRISKRRKTQIPAVAFLVEVLQDALPPTIKTVYFSQGGIREGFLWSQLPPEIRQQHPLIASTAGLGFQPTGTANPLQTSLPPALLTPHNLTLTQTLLPLLQTHHSIPKDARASSALHFPITGLLASVHGLSHIDRAMLALALSERWGADLPPCDTTFEKNLEEIVGVERVWCAKWLGRVGALLGKVYPAGVVGMGGGSGERIRIKCEEMEEDKDKEGKKKKKNKKRGGVRVIVAVRGVDVRDEVSDLEKMGKWGKGEGVGWRVEVVVGGLE